MWIQDWDFRRALRNRRLGASRARALTADPVIGRDVSVEEIPGPDEERRLTTPHPAIRRRTNVAVPHPVRVVERLGDGTFSYLGETTGIAQE